MNKTETIINLLIKFTELSNLNHATNFQDRFEFSSKKYKKIVVFNPISVNVIDLECHRLRYEKFCYMYDYDNLLINENGIKIDRSKYYKKSKNLKLRVSKLNERNKDRIINFLEETILIRG